MIDLRFSGCRITRHGDMVRIQVPPEEIQRFFDAAIRDSIVKKFKEFGFTYISLDLDDFTPRSDKEFHRSLAEEEPI